MACTGKLEESDHKTNDDRCKQKTSGLPFLVYLQLTTSFSNGLVNPFFQKVRNLKFHLRGLSSLQLNVIIEAEDSEKESEQKGDQVDDL